LPPGPETAGRGADGRPALSVVVCTHARPRYLAACLHGLARQSAAARVRCETIVVDSASPPLPAMEVAALAAAAGARLLRSETPGLSVARNLGLAAAGGRWLAYLDDDAVPEPDWAEALLARIAALPPDAAALGGRILPEWEAPLPPWWPDRLRGVLTIVEWPGFGEVGAPETPPEAAVYGANMAFAVAPLRAVGGFDAALGRVGARLLSGEEVEALDRLWAHDWRVFYDGAVAVRHHIQAERLRPGWLLRRLYWQGATDALRDRRRGRGRALRRLPPRLARLAVQAPLLAWPEASTRLMRARCGAAYNLGYARGCLLAAQTPLRRGSDRGAPGGATRGRLFGDATR
jgi:glycosyltransferase involved in cell wall biosynthesis